MGGQSNDFKVKLDQLMEDGDGYQSMWVEIQAKKGRRRWCWTHRQLKGAIEVEEPSGEVFLRGTKENQIFLRELVKEFTDEYHGPVPKMTTHPRNRVTPRRLISRRQRMWPK